MWGSACYVYYDGQTLGCQVRGLEEALAHVWNTTTPAAAVQYNSSTYDVVKSYVRRGGVLHEVDLKTWFAKTNELTESKRRHLKDPMEDLEASLAQAQ